MHNILCALWTGLGLAWLSGITLIADQIGGYQWIGHMGQTRTVALLAAMGMLCVASALLVTLLRRLPKPVTFAVAALAGLHLINAVVMYIQYSTNGHERVAMPFVLLSAILPTRTFFIGMPHANVSLLILPVVTLLACLFSLPWKPVTASVSHDV